MYHSILHLGKKDTLRLISSIVLSREPLVLHLHRSALFGALVQNITKGIRVECTPDLNTSGNYVHNTRTGPVPRSRYQGGMFFFSYSLCPLFHFIYDCKVFAVNKFLKKCCLIDRLATNWHIQLKQNCKYWVTLPICIGSLDNYGPYL